MIVNSKTSDDSANVDSATSVTFNEELTHPIGNSHAKSEIADTTESAETDNESSDAVGAENTKLHDRLGDAHYNILPTKQLVVCLFTMSLSLFVAFADQTAITVALPTIASDLGAEQSINWAPTATLVATCVCQVLYLRLADIFGRKPMLLAALAVLAAAELAGLFAPTPVAFYICRAGLGIGVGGAQLLLMILVLDVVTLKQRGKFQGILGLMIGTSNAVAPLLMAAFVRLLTWRNFYRMLCPIVVSVMVLTYFFIPNQKRAVDAVLALKKEKFRRIDYGGVVLSAAALVLILVPVSGGGATYAWNSPLVIGMLTAGGACLVAFVVVEARWALLPMLPPRIFRRPASAVLLAANFPFGMAYYSFTYYLPYYYELGRGWSTVHAAVMVIPLVVTTAVSSTTAGQIISWSGHYIHVIYFGFSMWLIAAALVAGLWHEKTSVGAVAVILIVMGVGVGCTLQPTMVACQAQARRADRLVVIGARNVLRSFGGAVGIAVASLVVSNSLLRQVRAELARNSPRLPSAYLEHMKSNIYTRASTSGLTAAQASVVRLMYMAALRDFYYLQVPLVAICLLAMLPVRDYGLQCIDEDASGEKKTVGSTEQGEPVRRTWFKRKTNKEKTEKSEETPMETNETRETEESETKQQRD